MRVVRVRLQLRGVLSQRTVAGGYSEQFGSVVAIPGITEKGYLDTRVTVTTPGGHSSIPPDHTVHHFLSGYHPEPLTSSVDF